MDAPVATAKQAPLREQLLSFGRPFWAANIMELLERFAYYGVRVVVPIYIASSEDPGGLHFTNAQKGTIFSFWAGVQCLLPLFTGGFADKYGRKSTILISIALKICGYLLMATQRSYGGFFMGCMVLAAGTAIFKPGVQGTLVRGTHRGNSSVGWGIFYQVVNIGGWLGPPLAGYLKKQGWPFVFYGCAVIVSLNFLMLLTYDDPKDAPIPDEPKSVDDKELAYREPAKQTANKTTMADRSVFEVLVYSVGKIATRPRLWSFVLIISGFWLMFMQLYDSLPNFIEEWTDSRSLATHLPAFLVDQTSRGMQMKQEWMINLDSTMIVLMMIPVAYVTGKIRRLASLVIGIAIASFGLFIAGFTSSAALCLAGIAIFAIGEMTAAPKVNEYLGVIAPKGEESLYMGYVNVPVAFGWVLGSKVAGELYDRLADKSNFARQYLIENALMPKAAAEALKREETMAALQKATGLDAVGATEMLWNRYHPATFWWVFVAVGIASAIGMLIYARVARGWSAADNA